MEIMTKVFKTKFDKRFIKKYDNDLKRKVEAGYIRESVEIIIDGMKLFFKKFIKEKNKQYVIYIIN